MDKWINKVALVTGASVGIGADIALNLANSGVVVVGLARRFELVKELSKKVTGLGKIYAKKCDITNESETMDIFNWIQSELGGIDILINNAGIFKANFLIDSSSDEFRNTFNTNVISSCICMREAIKSMRDRQTKGYVIIINSVLGRRIPDLTVPMFGIYPASKYALTALTEILRQELHFYKASVKVTSINPGMVDTDLLKTFDSALAARLPKLKVEDVTSAVMYCLSTPDSVRIDEISLQAMFSYDQ